MDRKNTYHNNITISKKSIHIETISGPFKRNSDRTYLKKKMKKIYWWKNLNTLSIKQNLKYNPKKNYIHVLEKALATILKVKFVIFTTSGSSALTLAFFCSEINKKKKVVIPNRTWVATAHAAYNLKYKIQLEDTNINTMCQNIPIKQIKNKNNIGCLVLVNLNGRLNNIKNYKNYKKEKNSNYRG